MDKTRFSESIVELKILTNRISWGADKTLFSLKYEVLFLVGKKEVHTPKELIYELCLAKSNIASMCNSLCKEGFLVKKRDKVNKKQIEYFITNEGKEFLAKKMNQIEKLKVNNDFNIGDDVKNTIELLKEIK